MCQTLMAPHGRTYPFLEVDEGKDGGRNGSGRKWGRVNCVWHVIWIKKLKYKKTLLNDQLANQLHDDIQEYTLVCNSVTTNRVSSRVQIWGAENIFKNQNQTMKSSFICLFVCYCLCCFHKIFHNSFWKIQSRHFGRLAGQPSFDTKIILENCL